MFRSRNSFAFVACAAALSLFFTGCSGNRSLLPATSSQAAGNLRGHGVHYGLARLASQPPVGMQMAFLMTDGTVLGQSYAGNTWYKYTPDANGGYSDGTWTQVAVASVGLRADRLCVCPSCRRSPRDHWRRVQHARQLPPATDEPRRDLRSGREHLDSARPSQRLGVHRRLPVKRPAERPVRRRSEAHASGRGDESGDAVLDETRPIRASPTSTPRKAGRCFPTARS